MQNFLTCQEPEDEHLPHFGKNLPEPIATNGLNCKRHKNLQRLQDYATGQNAVFQTATKPIGIKKGIPLYPNLVNLKSNTMKNTMQK